MSESPLTSILEIKHLLDGSREEFACQPCLVRPGRHAAVLYRLTRDWHFAALGLTVPAGSLSTGFFWQARPFNLYHWMTSEGETIGDYFNICGQTRISQQTIEWLDLALDLCLLPGRVGQFLDEDEIPHDLDPQARGQIDAGRAQLSRDAGRIARWAEALSARLVSLRTSEAAGKSAE